MKKLSIILIFSFVILTLLFSGCVTGKGFFGLENDDPVVPIPPVDPDKPADPIQPIPLADPIPAPEDPYDPVVPIPPVDPDKPADPIQPIPPADPDVPIMNEVVWWNIFTWPWFFGGLLG